MLVKLDPFRFGDFGTVAYGTMPSEPNKPFSWPADWKNKIQSSARCRATNYGKATLFNIEIPFKMTFVRIKRGENAGSTVANEIINVAEGLLPITKLEPGKEASYIFYIHNQGRDIVRPQFLDTATCLPLGGMVRTSVKVIQSTSIMHQAHSLWPVHDALKIVEEEERPKDSKSPPASLPEVLSQPSTQEKK